MLTGKRWGVDTPWESLPIYAKAQDIKLRQMLLYVEEKSNKCAKKAAKKGLATGPGAANAVCENFFKSVYGESASSVIREMGLEEVDERAAPLIQTR